MSLVCRSLRVHARPMLRGRLLRFVVLLLLATLVAAPGTLQAQHRAPVTLQRRAIGLVEDSLPERDRQPSASDAVIRAGGGALLGVVTAIGSFAAWYAIATDRECRGVSRGFCGTDSDRATPAIIIGSIPGVTLGTSLPRLGSPCSFGRRTRHALVGTAIGTAVGALVTLPAETETQLLTAGGGGIVGATSAIGRCR